jgi:RNA polymerase sigma factor (sigma-70 family)
VLHDIFVRVIEKAHQFNPKKASFRTWLFRIAHNHAVNLFRREKLVKFQSLEQNVGREGAGIHLSDTLADETQNMDKSSLALAVRECIGRLKKETERQAIVMYYIFGKNYDEMSAVLGKSISAVRKHVLSAGEKVKNCLDEKGIGAFG